jgi:hypothetical protein
MKGAPGGLRVKAESEQETTMETVTNRSHVSNGAWVLAVSALLVLGAPARAAQLAHETFTPSFPIHANGGTGFAGPWAQGGFNAFASGYVPLDRSLCHPRLRSEGGSVSGAAFQAINGAIRDLAQPLGAGTVYMSFLIQARGTLHEGIFNGFFGLTLNGSLGNDLFIGKPGAGAVAQYVLEHRGGFGQVPSSGSAATGRTTLLVLKAEFMPGNDLFTLYVDPAGRTEPTSGVIKADLDLGTVSQIGIYSSGAFAVDEIRIATSHAEVLPSGDGPRNDSRGCLVESR